MLYSSLAAPFCPTGCMLGMKVQPLLHHGMCSQQVFLSVSRLKLWTAYEEGKLWIFHFFVPLDKAFVFKGMI